MNGKQFSLIFAAITLLITYGISLYIIYRKFSKYNKEIPMKWVSKQNIILLSMTILMSFVASVFYRIGDIMLEHRLILCYYTEYFSLLGVSFWLLIIFFLTLFLIFGMFTPQKTFFENRKKHLKAYSIFALYSFLIIYLFTYVIEHFSDL